MLDIINPLLHTKVLQRMTPRMGDRTLGVLANLVDSTLQTGFALSSTMVQNS
jgi:hypothetical protein